MLMKAITQEQSLSQDVGNRKQQRREIKKQDGGTPTHGHTLG